MVYYSHTTSAPFRPSFGWPFSPASFRLPFPPSSPTCSTCHSSRLATSVTDTHTVYEAVVPGVSEEEIEVEVAGTQLRIQVTLAHRPGAAGTCSGKRTVSWKVPLGSSDVEPVATLDKGILRIEVPRPQDKSRTIRINTPGPIPQEDTPPDTADSGEDGK